MAAGSGRVCADPILEVSIEDPALRASAAADHPCLLEPQSYSEIPVYSSLRATANTNCRTQGDANTWAADAATWLTDEIPR